MRTRRLLLAILLLLLASCNRRYLFETPEKDRKERPLWWVLQHKEPGEKKLKHEDRWYRYEADFDYIKPGENIFRNTLYGQCPIEKARYRVTDRATGQVVRLETLRQIPCEPCHRR